MHYYSYTTFIMIKVQFLGRDHSKFVCTSRSSIKLESKVELKGAVDISLTIVGDFALLSL